MKKVSRFTALTLALCAAFSLSTAAFAADYVTPAEAAAGLTGRTQESILAEQEQTGKSLGAIAAEAGKLDEFHTAVLQIRADRLDQLITAGQLTRAQADAALQAQRDRQAYCIGVGCSGTNCTISCGGQNGCTLQDCPNGHNNMAGSGAAHCSGARGQGNGCRRRA